MLRILRNCLIVMLFLGWTLGYASTPINPSIAPMLEKVLPAVVNIRAQMKPELNPANKVQKSQKGEKPGQNNDENAQQQQPQQPDQLLSVGSGVIVDADKGFIITNAHVIDDAETVTVTLRDGHHYNAKIVGLDKPSDIALLQIPAKNLTSIPIADSNKLKVGDFVAAIGNPFGLNQTVTSGIVSAHGRTNLGIESYENFIQTDAPINPGNSGGALINMQGQLVGISTAILAPDRGSIGIGFAIPANMAKSVMLQLVEFGNVQRGALGIGAQDLTPDLANAFQLKETDGAAVTQVIPKSAAAQAGLHVGDIIKTVNGSPITNANDVVNTIGFLRVDSKINIEILRNNKSMSLTATLTDPKKRREMNQSADPFFYGVGLKHFTVSAPAHGDVDAILVVSVEEDTNAWHSDLRPGDVITSANQQKVSTIADLRKIAASAKNSLLLNVIRGGGAMFLVINGEDY